MQPKKQLKVQYIGIFEEIDSFYRPKGHFLKKGQKIRAWIDPPLIRAMPERKRFFSIDVFPNIELELVVYRYIFCLIQVKNDQRYVFTYNNKFYLLFVSTTGALAVITV